MAKQTKKEFFSNVAGTHNRTIGTYNPLIENITAKSVHAVAEAFKFGTGDVAVKIGRKQYIVEVVFVDDGDYNEIDLDILSREDFENQYGWDFFEEEE